MKTVINYIVETRTSLLTRCPNSGKNYWTKRKNCDKRFRAGVFISNHFAQKFHRRCGLGVEFSDCILGILGIAT
jgi:hypothetical protein